MAYFLFGNEPILRYMLMMPEMAPNITAIAKDLPTSLSREAVSKCTSNKPYTTKPANNPDATIRNVALK